MYKQPLPHSTCDGPHTTNDPASHYIAILQACASTSILNYAPALLEDSGMQQHADSILWSSGVGIGKVHC